MWQHTKTFLLVTLVTLIIWVFAESESLQPRTVRDVEISLVPTAGSNYAVDLSQESAAVRGNTVRVDMVIEGPAAALDTAERLLRRPITVNPGDAGFVTDPLGRRTVDLQTVLRGKLDLASRGVSIKSVAPETVEATVERLVTKQVKIDVEVPGGELESPAKVKPALATITLPESQVSKITENTAAIARIDPTVLSRINPGREETIAAVPLRPPPDLALIPKLKIEPLTADVSLTLRTKTATVKIATVPVHVRIAPSELNKWDIDIPEQDRFLNDVSVSGPVELIRQIQDKTIPVIATVSLSYEDLERGITSKEAIFCEPYCESPGGPRFTVANRTVRLTIKRREPAAPTQPIKQP